MKRIAVRRPGAELELIEEADPAPAGGLVRVRVRAAGVNYADVIVREGYYEAAKGHYPITPGFEFAGVVDALGARSGDFKVGDRVFGFTRFGGYSSVQVCEPGRLRLMPEGWDFAECAALPAVHFTAYHGLFKVAKVAAGETILVHSAAGGVGTALLQQAKLAGLRAIAVVGSPRKESVARDYGADAVVVRGPDLWADLERAAPDGFDAIFDANGVTTLKPGFARLKLGGRLVVYGFAEIFPRGRRPGLLGMARNWLRVPRFSPLDLTASNRAVMGFNVVFLTDKAELAKEGFDAIAKWARSGEIRKPPITVFPVERAADAHRALESGETVGKLILTF
ncbi:MAG TPA: zinc-binding dehydrogenase [Elusimicrobiota bacterium]|jgi:NADPH:quinone reductase-like Zn-dependent oxidoreductase|nr:zinc-binding dehydrogenase [Elusimicrobiota bacterium]